MILENYTLLFSCGVFFGASLGYLICAVIHMGREHQ